MALVGFIYWLVMAIVGFFAIMAGNWVLKFLENSDSKFNNVWGRTALDWIVILGVAGAFAFLMSGALVASIVG